MDNDYGYVGLCPDNIGSVAVGVVRQVTTTLDTEALHGASNGEYISDMAA